MKTWQEMPKMAELAIKDIKILITASYRFRKLEEKNSV